MPYLIDSDGDIVFIRQFGIVADGELDEIHDWLESLTAGPGPRDMLIDTRDASRLPTAADFLLAIERAGRTPVCGQTAIVMPVRFREQAEFIDSACRNRGMRVRVFYDPETALAWLRPGPVILKVTS